MTVLRVEAEEVGQRLDVFLRARIDGLGRAGAKRLVEEGRVRVNGRHARKGAVLAAGDSVEVAALERPTLEVVADGDLPITVVHEDPLFVVVDKAPGVPSQPLRPGERGTVANALVARYPEMVGLSDDPREAGLVHRLDVDTGGLLVAARTREAHGALVAMVRDGRMEKHYHALVAVPLAAPAEITYPLGHDRGDDRRVRACFSLDDAVRYDGKPARTEILRVTPRGPFFLVEARAAKAQRHQIRAHLAAEGAPLVGDSLYGGPPAPAVTHHLLHASLVRFPHPATGQTVEVRSEPPASWPL